MKSFSNDIVTPATQNEAIRVAFEEQNAFIEAQANSVVKRITILVASTILSMTCIVGGFMVFLQHLH